MAVPSSGLIDIADIQTEFGGPSANRRLKQYYAGGSYVPSGQVNGAGTPISSSGDITLKEFYGAQSTVYLINYPTFPASQSEREAIGAAWCIYRLTSGLADPTVPNVGWLSPQNFAGSNWYGFAFQIPTVSGRNYSYRIVHTGQIYNLTQKYQSQFTIGSVYNLNGHRDLVNSLSTVTGADEQIRTGSFTATSTTTYCGLHGGVSVNYGNWIGAYNGIQVWET